MNEWAGTKNITESIHLAWQKLSHSKLIALCAYKINRHVTYNMCETMLVLRLLYSQMAPAIVVLFMRHKVDQSSGHIIMYILQTLTSSSNADAL